MAIIKCKEIPCKRSKTHTLHIAVAGTGYVGLVTGVCLASKGHVVTCVDPDEKRIGLLNRGQAPIHEADLQRLMKKHKARLAYTTDYETAYSNADIIMIAVGTPEKKDGSANLKYIYEAAEQIAASVERDCIVVLKSTVPIGTGDKLEEYIRRRIEQNIHADVVSNPEFLAQGTAVYDTLHPARIVIGSEDAKAEEITLRIYDGFDGERVCVDRRSAEMIKYASNDFLALKLSYINEIANLCEYAGADVEAVTYGMGLDPRIENQFMRAGIGYDGSCFPKDTKALNWFATFNDRELKTIKAAIEVNEQQKLKLIKKARKYYDSFDGLKVAVLGLAFKPGTDDLREAPSLVNIPWLLDEGAAIKAWDPVAAEKFSALVEGDISYCDTIEETLEGAGLCFIFTEWDDVKALDAECFATLMERPVILDGRNCFSLEQFEGKQMIYDSVGRKTVGIHEEIL